MTSYPDAQRGRPSASLHYAVGEINGKLDQVLATVLPQLKEFDGRLTVVESRLTYAMGGGAVVLFLITSYEVIRVIIPHI